LFGVQPLIVTPALFLQNLCIVSFGFGAPFAQHSYRVLFLWGLDRYCTSTGIVVWKFWCFGTGILRSVSQSKLKTHKCLISIYIQKCKLTTWRCI
jgi:hypothetical protein